MEKIKKYNQVILAIGGTVALLFLIGASLFALVESLSYYSWDDDDAYDATTIVAEEVTDSLVANEYLRTQIITLRNFKLLDSAAALYVLPVGQKNLGEAEDIDESLLGLVNVYGRRKSYSRSSGGVSYNNLVVFDVHLTAPQMLFQDKVSIHAYDYFENENGKYLFIQLADSDTNKDGFLDHYDIQKLVVYNLEAAAFLDITKQENASFLGPARGAARTELIFQYGADRNRNGEFERRYEPTSYYSLDLQTGKLELLLSVDMLEGLQDILEGSAEETEEE